MIVRTLLVIILLPTLFIIPDQEQGLMIVCVESFMLKAGRIYVLKSEYMLPSNYSEALLLNGKLRRKRIWIEIYVATPYGIKLAMIIPGKIIAATPERYEFKDMDKNLFKEEPK